MADQPIVPRPFGTGSQRKTGVGSALTVKEEMFSHYYSNPHGVNPKNGKRTYLNATQAAHAAYATESMKTASAIGAELLRKDRVTARLEQLFDRAGLGDEDSVSLIKDIANGTAQREETIEVVDKDGRIRQLRRTRRPRFGDSLRALELRYRLTGHFTKQHTEGQMVSDTYKELMRRYLKHLER
jgi:hypothetical protein